MNQEKGTKIIALAGNPNVGKSTLFNGLTGRNQHTGNWPGKTVAKAEGYCSTTTKSYLFVDLPGTYSLAANSPEEEIARDFICSGRQDAVIVVCDALCLERSLNLVLQTMEICSNVIVCVNLMDEARKKHVGIDLFKLEKLLKVPVIGTSAHDKKSIQGLLGFLDGILDKPRDSFEKTFYAESVEQRIAYAEQIAKEVIVTDNKEKFARDQKIDELLTSRKTGYPMMIGMLALVFWITIVGANYPSKVLWNLMFKGQGWISDFLCWVHIPMWFHDMLIFGVYRVLAWVVSVMLPPMAIFFPLFTLLEDAGFLPRIAYNMDGILNKCKACGKQALTMAMGFGCNAVGVSGCRIIDSPRERMIAILTNSFVPCNGRFPALIAVITMFFVGNAFGKGISTIISALVLTAVIVFAIGVTFLISKILSETLLKGVPSSFTLELPPYRKPQIGNVIIRSVFDRTLFVLGRAVVIAAPAGAVIWMMANVQIGDMSLLNHCAGFLNPLAKAMGLDGVILMAFILGLPANEIVLPIVIMGYMAQGTIVEMENLAQIRLLLTAHGWTIQTAASFLLFSLMHWPCSTTLLTIKKETGSVRWMAAGFLIPAVTGIIICIVFTAIFNVL